MDSRPKILINMSHIKSNILQIRHSVGEKVEIWPAVKADAYGLGARHVTQALSNIGGVFVATIYEALELRESVKDLKIATLHGANNSKECDLAKRNDIILVANSIDQLALYSKSAVRRMILHVDTGMTRLGVDLKDYRRLISDPQFNFEMVMSHLSCSDEAGHEQNELQLSYFKTVASEAGSIPCSLANSGGIYLGKEYHFNIVRPGAFLYGINSTASGCVKPLTVVTVMAPVLQIRELTQDQYVGYSCTYKAAKGDCLVTLGMGYADGLMRSLSNLGGAYYKGHTLPFVGRVSMDTVVVDATKMPKSLLLEMKYVELLGENIKVDDVAVAAGTNGYEILTSLNKRCVREYI